MNWLCIDEVVRAVLVRKVKGGKGEGGAGWPSAVGLLAVYRLEPSEKQIHFGDEQRESLKLAATNDIAFHGQPA